MDPRLCQVFVTSEDGPPVPCSKITDAKTCKVVGDDSSKRVMATCPSKFGDNQITGPLGTYQTTEGTWCCT